jgi:DNA-binding MarR family transcriptional regulator
MLRLIMAQPGISLSKLLEILEVEREPVERNLAALEREGFLVKRGRGFRVAEEK